MKIKLWISSHLPDHALSNLRLSNDVASSRQKHKLLWLLYSDDGGDDDNDDDDNDDDDDGWY